MVSQMLFVQLLVLQPSLIKAILRQTHVLSALPLCGMLFNRSQNMLRKLAGTQPSPYQRRVNEWQWPCRLRLIYHSAWKLREEPVNPMNRNRCQHKCTSRSLFGDNCWSSPTSKQSSHFPHKMETKCFPWEPLLACWLSHLCYRLCH